MLVIIRYVLGLSKKNISLPISSKILSILKSMEQHSSVFLESPRAPSSQSVSLWVHNLKLPCHEICRTFKNWQPSPSGCGVPLCHYLLFCYQFVVGIFLEEVSCGWMPNYRHQQKRFLSSLLRCTPSVCLPSFRSWRSYAFSVHY